MANANGVMSGCQNVSPDTSPSGQVVRVIAAIAMTLATACGSEQREVAVPPECTMTIDGVEHFIGSPNCFKRFPERKMSGYWVVGFEYSVYYADRPQAVWELDPNAVWLSPSEEAGQAAASYFADGKPHLLQVDFVGIHPGRPGSYGVGFRDGVHMTRLLRVQELADVEWRRGVAPDTSQEGRARTDTTFSGPGR